MLRAFWCFIVQLFMKSLDAVILKVFYLFQKIALTDFSYLKNLFTTFLYKARKNTFNFVYK